MVNQLGVNYQSINVTSRLTFNSSSLSLCNRTFQNRLTYLFKKNHFQINTLVGGKTLAMSFLPFLDSTADILFVELVASLVGHHQNLGNFL